MKNLRKSFERFCYKNRNKGIPNLMMYICIGNAVVYLLSMFDQSYTLYSLLRFHKGAILSGQIWRLITYPLTMSAGMGSGLGIILVAISLFCFYSLGAVIERNWGTLKFNLFYLSGIVMMDVYCMIFGGTADVTYLNLSLILAYSTMYPDARFLIFYVIPVKAWVLALIDLAFVAINLFTDPFPYNFFSIVSLANYFLFFGADVLNLFPLSFRVWLRKVFHLKPRSNPKIIQFHVKPSSQQPKQNYNHRCTVCGRTDVTNPELEFRYCSRCKGYYCYCQDHINDHAHIQ